MRFSAFVYKVGSIKQAVGRIGSIGGDRISKLNVELVPAIAGITSGVLGVTLLGFGGALCFGAAYAGYHAVNRVCSLGIATYQSIKIKKQPAHFKAMAISHSILKMGSVVAGVGIATAIILSTGAPVAFAVSAGCVAMKLIDFAIDWIMSLCWNECITSGGYDNSLQIDFSPKVDARNTLFSIIAFAGGATVAGALSSVCPVPGVSEVAGVATTAALEFVLNNVDKLPALCKGPDQGEVAAY